MECKLRDTAREYSDTKKEINKLEDKLINIKEEVSNYKVTSSKYKDKTLAEIAHKDFSYYKWLKSKSLIPYTINIDIDLYIMDKISSKISLSMAEEYSKRKEEQGYVGRYMIFKYVHL